MVTVRLFIFFLLLFLIGACVGTVPSSESNKKVTVHGQMDIITGYSKWR